MSDEIPSELIKYKYQVFSIRFILIIIPLLGATMLLAPVLGIPRLPTVISLEVWAIWLTIFFLLSFLVLGLLLPTVTVYSWKILFKLTSEEHHESITEFRELVEDWDDDDEEDDEDDSNSFSWS